MIKQTTLQLLLLLSFLIFLSPTIFAIGDDYRIEYVNVHGPNRTVIGSSLNLSCITSPSNSLIWWQLNGENITSTSRVNINKTIIDTNVILYLYIHTVEISDTGNYTCHVVLPENNKFTDSHSLFVNVVLEGRILSTKSDRVLKGKNANLHCSIQGYPLTRVEWKIEKSGLFDLLPQNIRTKQLNETHWETQLNFFNIDRNDNGTYLCSAYGPNGYIQAPVHLFVLDKPQVTIDLVKAVGAHVLFVNWTVNDGNEPIKQYYLQFKKNGTNQWLYSTERVGVENTSFLIRNLSKNTMYQVSLYATNDIGQGETYVHDNWVSTLEEDPVFVPKVTVKGTTSNSLSMGWTQPPPGLRDFIQYYHIKLQNNGREKDTINPSTSMNDYLFTNLVSATTYKIKIAACSEYTKTCGNWSEEVSGTTSDGVSDPPENVTVQCRFDNISHASLVFVTWQPPKNPYGQITHYQLVLQGVANFRNDKGVIEQMTYGPKVKSIAAEINSARFEFVPPNTNYTVRVSGVTRSRHVGKEEVRRCSMPPTVPEKEKLLRIDWKKIESEKGKWLFRLNLQRVSERNGPICCYMVYVVKLKPGQRASDLPHPEDIPVSSYEQVHKNLSGGAYIAETFDSASLREEIFLGDGKSSNIMDSPCRDCINLQHRRRVELTTTTTTAATPPHPTTDNIPLAKIPGLNSNPPTTDREFEVTTAAAQILAFHADDGNDPDLYNRRKRVSFHQENGSENGRSRPADNVAYDGALDRHFNYTGFVEIVVYGQNGNLIPAYSNYFMPMIPGPTVLTAVDNSRQLTIALYVLIGLVIIVFILVIVLFVLHNYTKTVAEEQGIEMTFTNTLMHLCRNVGGRHVPVSSSPPDIPPIPKAELAAAVAERHRDSDYGFQHEFELLPDRFPDRTTRASEARENFYKNRYPDIKAYDQTRVRLSQIDGIAGSDYINANYVIGYKERKKFICAQGPMDNTVNDFWRMIWEQHLEMVLMLTNLEEYSKVKCAKYWPESEDGEKKFGDFYVSHVNEKRFSDYIVRELKLRHGGVESPTEKDKEEKRIIVQYHYLVWKDFMAPKHPSGILKFIKRINEDYSLEKGPILIHCSAGVGRTGTLVALDSLLQQLNEEKQVAIFNTVCDLRHQRNFLVQSLEQYIFVYRALLELSQSGDTEIKASQLKSQIEKLRHRENGKDKCVLEEEFEKLELLVDDRGKSSSVAGSEENKAKNRSEEVIPYDRNRVMLAPVPGRDHSTYINASFIEGYDNSDCFIITQDPLPATLSDFWRMISEQCVSTLVMISDLGDGPRKCIRYWPEPDDESMYDNIKVRYIQSESCPYYTRREFAVTNVKTDDSLITTQFQYNGWPTVEGEVPEVTRGLIELVNQTQENHRIAAAESSTPGPIVVHCNWGAERSSIFVALTILVEQLKTEKAVDIFSTARRLRSQRPMMLSNYAQYELLHRAIVNYADLHHMTENGTTSPL
ncbi:UNVERIFIED_CONTAM: hypothetical protein PYX00_003690 [Menopon gallinae]|uniref:protein-tyrosine-phosphatase n=1 Tax=Menopon gallinae TaxID=328185 RepID=A0AAW2I1C7_9NEOP